MNKKSGWVAVIIGAFTATVPTFVLFQAVTFLFVVPLALGLICVFLGVIALRTQSSYAGHVAWIAAILMLIAIVLPFGMIAYYNQPGYPIVFIIPSGYRGPVRLVVDQEQGVDVPLVDSKYTYRIPESGTLVIKDGSPFGHWHSMTAMYANGKPIPMDYEPDLPSNAVSLHSNGAGVGTVGGRQERRHLYFIGTEAESKRYVP